MAADLLYDINEMAVNVMNVSPAQIVTDISHWCQ